MYSETRIVYSVEIKQNLPKSINDNVLDPHKSFPSCQLNAVSCKNLEIQASCIAKQRTILNRKFVWFKGALIPHESRNSEEAIVS